MIKRQLKAYVYAHDKDHTISRLYDEQGRFICWILEDPMRPEKIAGVTAIPRGTYDIRPQEVGKFYQAAVKEWGRASFPLGVGMPRLAHVPNFLGVLIHWGNNVQDTRGCLLTGSHYDEKKKTVTASKVAFYDLFRRYIRPAWENKQAICITLLSEVSPKEPKNARY